jgi:hypothetical protein
VRGIELPATNSTNLRCRENADCTDILPTAQNQAVSVYDVKDKAPMSKGRDPCWVRSSGVISAPMVRLYESVALRKTECSKPFLCQVGVL